MAGLFGVLGVAGRGLDVAQRGVRNTAQNIANVNTPGYSRQRQVVAAIDPVITTAGNLGGGPEQITITRAADALLQAQRVQQNGSAGSTNVQAEALASLEQVVNEQTGQGIGSALSSLYSAFSELARSPEPSSREGLVAAAQRLIDTVRGADRQMRDIQESAHRAIDHELAEINRLSAEIAELNRRIGEREGLAPANELHDQRDELVRQIAEKVEVTAFVEGKHQMVMLSGLPLVEGTNSHELLALVDATNPFNGGFYRIGFDLGGGSNADVTDEIGGGRLGGLLRVRDDVLPGAIRSVDTIAFNVVQSVNAVHASGVGIDGTIGNFFAGLTGVEDAGRDIQLDANILASSDAIAAGLAAQPADNRNALALAELRSAASPIFLPGDPPGPASGPSRTLLDHAASIVADIGREASAMEASRAQQMELQQVLEDRRDAISGVSIDEEVTMLVQLQAAYQANARVMQTVDRLLQDVMAIL